MPFSSDQVLPCLLNSKINQALFFFLLKENFFFLCIHMLFYISATLYALEFKPISMYMLIILWLCIEKLAFLGEERIWYFGNYQQTKNTCLLSHSSCFPTLPKCLASHVLKWYSKYLKQGLLVKIPAIFRDWKVSCGSLVCSLLCFIIDLYEKLC